MSDERRRRRDHLPGPRKPMVVLCSRIGEAQNVPPGYATADCTLCDAAVWIDPRILDAAERLRMLIAPICDHCSPRGSPSGPGASDSRARPVTSVQAFYVSYATSSIRPRSFEAFQGLR